MTYYPKLDLVNMNLYIKFGENLSNRSLDFDQKQILYQIKGHDSGTNVRQMTCYNPKLDLVSMNVYIKVGETLSIFSQDIEWKLNFGVNQGL